MKSNGQATIEFLVSWY